MIKTRNGTPLMKELTKKRILAWMAAIKCTNLKSNQKRIICETHFINGKYFILRSKYKKFVK